MYAIKTMPRDTYKKKAYLDIIYNEKESFIRLYIFFNLNLEKD